MTQVKEFIRKYYFAAGMALLLALAVFLRLYKLALIPMGRHVDEAALGYNAWCLAHYGVDRYLHEMPIYPQNYYGGQSPLYTYLAALLLKIPGVPFSDLTIRIPGFLFSMLIVIFGAATINEVFKNRNCTLAATAILTISPYFILQGRYAFDCNLMLGCSVMALYSLVKYLSDKKLWRLVVCGAAFAFVLYSYALAYFTIAFFLIYAALYLLFVREITVPRTVVWAFSVCIFALPILLFVASLLLQLEPFKFLGFTIEQTATQRMSDIDPGPNSLPSIWHTIYMSLLSDGFVTSTCPRYGNMYYTSVPFVVIGFVIACVQTVQSIRKRKLHVSALFLFFFLAVLTTAALVYTDHAINRANAVFAAEFYFLMLAFYEIVNRMKHCGKAFAGVAAAAYAIWFAAFARYYFVVYPIEHFPLAYFRGSAADAIEYARKNLDYSTIYVDYSGYPEFNLMDYPISPYEWNDRVAYDEFNCVVELPEIDEDAVYIIEVRSEHLKKELYEAGFSCREFPSTYCLFTRE